MEETLTKEAQFEAYLDRLHLLITTIMPGIIKVDGKSLEWKEGFAETLFQDSHLQGKFCYKYESATDFLAYYGSSAPGIKFMQHFLSDVTEKDYYLWRPFAQMTWNNSLEIVKQWKEGTYWEALLKKSKVDTYGNLQNWYRFYVFLLDNKNADPSWARFLLSKFLTYK